jgi:hypothetical protein
MKQVKKNDKPIKDVLNDFVHQKKITSGFNNTKLKKIWKDKMGTSINKYTKSIFLRNGILYLVIESAPLKHELKMGKHKLMNLLNEELGEIIIKDINIK